MKECSFCGAPLDDDSVFCTNCGKKVEFPRKTCPKCGAEAETDSVFCAKCGTRLETQTISTIDTQTVPPTMPTQDAGEVIYDCEEENNRKWWYIVCSIIVLALLALGWYMDG